MSTLWFWIRKRNLIAMKTRILKQATFRGIIPFVIMSALALIMTYQKIDPSQTKGTFLAGIIISIVAAASVIYDIEKWSLLKQSAIHFIVMILTIFPCLLISGWYELSSFADYLKVFGIFLLCGCVFWTIGYFVFGKLLNR